MPLMKEASVRFEKLSVADCANGGRKSSSLTSPGAFTSLIPAILPLAARAEAVLNAFLKEGGEYRQAQATPGRSPPTACKESRSQAVEILNADSYVFACGPWLWKVFSFLAPHITPTRQEVFFFGTAAGDLRFTEAQLPVWIDNGKHLFYGNSWESLARLQDR